MLNYDFNIEYIASKDFGQADALSRLISNQKGKEKEEEMLIACIESEREVNVILINILESLPITKEQILKSISQIIIIIFFFAK